MITVCEYMNVDYTVLTTYRVRHETIQLPLAVGRTSIPTHR
jgi:hypothetical protein